MPCSTRRAAQGRRREKLLGVTDRQARRIAAPLVELGVLTSKTVRDPFPVRLAPLWMPSSPQPVGGVRRCGKPPGRRRSRSGPRRSARALWRWRRLLDPRPWSGEERRPRSRASGAPRGAKGTTDHRRRRASDRPGGRWGPCVGRAAARRLPRRPTHLAGRPGVLRLTVGVIPARAVGPCPLTQSL